MPRGKFLSPPARTFLLNLIAFTPYLLYTGFVLSIGRGPVDYHTFMESGQAVLDGGPLFAGGAYYPAPFLWVFALFRLLPQPVSMALWLLLPVLAAWQIAGRKPWVFLYAPLFAHFTGGQSSFFGLVGLWGFLRSRESNGWKSGLWLGLMAFKPQLMVFPLLYAAREWTAGLRRGEGLPRQALGWLAAMALWYLSGLPFGVDWPLQWLGNARPVFLRAQAAILPRSLLVAGVPAGSLIFWGLVALGGAGLIWLVWRLARRRMPLDLWVFLSGVVFPLLHDYDLIQFIPLLNTPLRRRWALIASIPLWLVILFAYQNDAAWFVVTLIAPTLTAVAVWEARRTPAPILREVV